MKTTIYSSLLATASAIAIRQVDAPDNNTILQTQKFNLRGLNIGENQDVFCNDTYLGSFHESAGDYGTLAGLTEKAKAPAWFLTGTELSLEEGGAQLQYQVHGQDYPWSVVVDSNQPLSNYFVNAGNGTPSFGNFTGSDGSLYVSHMQVAQNGYTYGCKGEGVTEGEIVIKYLNTHIDPVTPEGCSQISFKVELL